MKREQSLKNTNVLVTGGAGFIGSSLVRQLKKMDCEVTVLDNLCAGKEEHLKGTKANLIVGDIRNRELLREILRRDKIKFCFHLAAEPYIPKGYQNPEMMFEVNTLGTIQVIKACHKAKIRKIIYYSTSEVYGTAKTIPMNETHQTTPHSIYALAKFAGDRACFILWKEQKIPVIILRQFNCFGPREAQPYIIPEIISQFKRGNHLYLGNINAKRDFTYVDDAVKGAIKLMEMPNFEGQVVNMGRGKNWSVKEIADAIAKIMNRENYELTIDQKKLRPFDVDELLCDNTLFNKLTGEIKFTPFNEGLRRTIDWYYKHGKKWSWEE